MTTDTTRANTRSSEHSTEPSTVANCTFDESLGMASGLLFTTMLTFAVVSCSMGSVIIVTVKVGLMLSGIPSHDTAATPVC